MFNTYKFLILIAYVISNNAYKITREVAPIPALKNAALEYKGPVFLIKETDDVNEPFIGLIVDGGIEMVRPNPRPISAPYTNVNVPVNETIQEVQEDPEYFAVLVTPETVAQAQISRTTTITIPLTVLLAGVSAKMPWLMVLKKQNHFDYFKTLITLPLLPVNPPQRRRYKRSAVMEQGRLFSGDKNYEMIYSEVDKSMLHGICTNIVKDLIFLNEMMQRSTNNVQYTYDSDTFDIKVNKNETKIDKSIEGEYAIGTEYKVTQKTP